MEEKSGGVNPKYLEEPIHDHVWKKIAPKSIGECSLDAAGKSVCASADTVAAVRTIIGSSTEDPAEVISEAKTQTGCKTEKCAIVKLADKIGPAAARDIELNFKEKGPTDNAWLTNTNIDAVLHQWAGTRTDFFPYNFNMLDYARFSFRNGHVVDAPDTLATTTFQDLYSRGFRTAACVINTDKYSGNGRHWMALFIDARHPPWTVEFFNSSGNAPQPEYVNWLEKTKMQMEAVAAEIQPRPEVKIVRVSNKRHQNSTSECGVYSLYYIRARLTGIPADYFSSNWVPDSNMFEFRQHLFDGSSAAVQATTGGQFDWENFRKNVRIGWEK